MCFRTRISPVGNMPATGDGPCDMCGDAVLETPSSYKCMHGHVFQVCGGCVEAFIVKCDDVGERIRDAYHNLQEKANQGCTKGVVRRRMKEAPLSNRKLTPAAKDQLKALEESETGQLLCPTEDGKFRADLQALVPVCGSILRVTGGEGGSKASKKSQDAPVKPELAKPRDAVDNQANQATQASATLVDDCDLVPLRPAGDDDESPVVSKGKKCKANKNKPPNVLLLAANDPEMAAVVFGTPQRSASAWSDTSSSAPTASPAAAGQMAASSFLRRVAADEMDSKVQQVQDIVQCSRARAQELFDKAGGRVDGACELFYDAGAQPARPAQPAPPAQAPQLTRPAPAAEALFASLLAPPEPAATARAAARLRTPPAAAPPARPGTPPPMPEHGGPPARPPPPPLPAGWREVWNEEEQDYYFWHVKTSEVRWDVPEEDKVLSSPPLSAPPAPRAQDPSADVVARLVEITGCDDAMARRVLSLHGGDFEAAVRACVESGYGGVKQVLSRDSPTVGGPPNARASSELEPAVQAARSELRIQPGEYMCTRHWKASGEISSCLKLVHGERLQISWAELDPAGWAYGAPVSEPEKWGYIPQAILMPAPPALKRVASGQCFRILVLFEAPTDIGGYVSLRPGDEVVVEAAVEEPCVWAYVSVVGTPTKAQGWAPLAVLDVNSRPQPAG